MKTYVLSVPSKKMDEANWAGPLNSYLTSIYGKNNEYAGDVSGFNKLRQDLKGVNADSTGIKLYYKYYSQLELLDLRIPFASINGHRKISFVWHDAFTKSVSHKQHSLPFEKANVLFNLASILTKVACQKYDESQRSSDSVDDTVKESLVLFQQAAGIFQFISENFLHAPSEDLSQGTLKFLVRLTLAQSQEIFVLKAIAGDLDQKKNSLIARLCASTANHYNECAGMVDNAEHESHAEFEVVDTTDEIDGLEDLGPEPQPVDDTHATVKIEPVWGAVIAFKKAYYKSLAYYFHGLHLEASAKYGEGLAYMTKSSELLEEVNGNALKAISKSGSHEAYEILDNYKFHKDALGIKITDLTKDNDLIYHDIVPSLVTLPEVKPLDGVKQIPISNNALFNEINQHNYENFLKNVIPIDTHELLSYYSEEKSQFLRNELDSVDVSNEELASVLEYLKMPQALVNLKQILTENEEQKSQGPTEISPGVIEKVDEIFNGYNSDQSNKERILGTRKEIYGIIGEVEQKMATNPSVARFKDEVIYLKKSLYDTTSFDEKIFQLINNDNNQLYNTLKNGSTSPQFKQMFESKPEQTKPVANLLDFDPEPSDRLTLTQKVGVIERLLFDLNFIKSQKAKLLDTLKNAIHDDDISDILILNSKVKTTNEIKSVIFPEEMKKFQPFAADLDRLTTKQKQLISMLKDEWRELSSLKEVREIQSSRAFKDNLKKDQEGRIEQFYTSWKRYNEGLKKGAEIYGQLSGFARSLKDKVNQEIHNEINTERIANLNLQNMSPMTTGNSQASISQRGQTSQGNFGYPNAGQAGYGQMQAGFAHTAPTGAEYGMPTQDFNSAPDYRSPHDFNRGPPPPPPQDYRGEFRGQDLRNGYGYQQPPLHRSSTSSSYDRAPPSLPPKTGQYTVPGSNTQLYPGPMANSMHNNQQKSNSQSNLIYDQPSTYNPDMYNFFSK